MGVTDWCGGADRSYAYRVERVAAQLLATMLALPEHGDETYPALAVEAVRCACALVNRIDAEVIAAGAWDDDGAPPERAR